MNKRLAAWLLPAILAVPANAQSFDPPVAVDVNPDPTIVEVNLSANVTTWQYIPGVDTTVWAYSDDSPGGSGTSVPGPTIQANVGDTIRVHFTNNLPEATTVHWHGIENYADMDGAHISQLHVQPGATFDYEFPVLREGLYWYHPHVRTFDQVEKGLHAGLLGQGPRQGRDRVRQPGWPHGRGAHRVLRRRPPGRQQPGRAGLLVHRPAAERAVPVEWPRGQRAAGQRQGIQQRHAAGHERRGPELVRRQRGQHDLLPARDLAQPRDPRGTRHPRDHVGDRLRRWLHLVPGPAQGGAQHPAGLDRAPRAAPPVGHVRRCVAVPR